MEFLKSFKKNSLGEHTIICHVNGIEQQVKLEHIPTELSSLFTPFFDCYKRLVELEAQSTLIGIETSVKDGRNYMRVFLHTRLGKCYYELKGQKIEFDYTTPTRLKETEIKLEAARQSNDENEVKYLKANIDKQLMTNQLVEYYQSISTWINDNWLKLLQVDTNQLKLFADNNEQEKSIVN